MTKIKIILDSDQHYHHDDSTNQMVIGTNKDPNTVNKIISLITDNDISAVILPGDFTIYGWDAKRFACFFKNGDYDECGAFINQCYLPIKDKARNVLLCAGNHDTYVKWPYTHKPIFNLIKKEFGSLYYSRQIDGIMFYSCHLYPDANIRNWLKNELANNNLPTIIFFHYNLYNQYSDFWSQADKDAFAQVIEGHRDKIVCIFNGHFHISNVGDWNGFKTCIAASNQTALCTYDTDTKEFSAEFV